MEEESSKKFRILSLDGGGIKGVFSVSFLASIEESINDKIFNYFDLIAGTSTGGIIALGLGLGYSAKEMLSYYEEFGPKIFKGSNGIMRTLKHFIFSKYSDKSLKDSLIKIFNNRTLGESRNRLLIPAFNLENGEIHIYKTAHHRDFCFDYKKTAVDVALATASAPTYFPAHRSANGVPFCDGGMCANNPLCYGIIEALIILGWPKESLRFLSVGCTSEPLNVGRGRLESLGKRFWASKVVDIFMMGQSASSLSISKFLLGNNDNIKRINPVVGNNKFSLDNVNEIPSLKGLGYTEARKEFNNLKDIFFDTKVEEFIPCNK